MLRSILLHLALVGLLRAQSEDFPDSYPDSCDVTSRVADREDVTVTVVVLRCFEANPKGPITVDWPDYCTERRSEVQLGPGTLTVITTVCMDWHLQSTTPEPSPSTGPSTGPQSFFEDLVPSQEDLPEECQAWPMERRVHETPDVTVTAVAIGCVTESAKGPVEVKFPDYCVVRRRAYGYNAATYLSVITAFCEEVHGSPGHGALRITDLPEQEVRLPAAPFQLALKDGPIAYKLSQTLEPSNAKHELGLVVAAVASAFALVSVLAAIAGVRRMRKRRDANADSTGLETSLQPVR